MLERGKNSILEVLMNNEKRSAEEEVEEKFEEDLGKFIAYSYCKHNFNLDKNEEFDGSLYLLVIKDNRKINFHRIRNYVKYEKKRDMIDVEGESRKVESESTENEVHMLGDEEYEVRLKKNPLNLKTLIVSKRPDKVVERHRLTLIIEASVYAEAHLFNFCCCLEAGNRMNMFYYDPEELDYANERDTITLDNISIREVFSSVKSVYNEEVLRGFSDVYNMLISTLKKGKWKLKGFDEVENLFDSTINNYKHINAINKVVNYDGLRINKCYLDEQIVESFSSFSYLDDSTIDFFNQFTYNYIMSEKQQDSWVILSTYFVTKIKQYKNAKEAYTNTWKWTRKFKRPLPLNHFIFIPINVSQVHWSLVIIAYPKYAIRYHSNKSEKKASIIHLDSLGTKEVDENMCNLLKNYLYEEFDNRCKELKEKGFEFMLDQNCWDSVWPPRGVPLQNNGYDCGIYLIEYIIYLVLNENVFSQIIPKYYEQFNASKVFEPSRSSKWFTQNQIQQRRLNMKQVLKFMKDNPKWSADDEKIKYIIDKMTQQY
nr:ubiquitin-like protease [Theileria orientalis]